MRPGAQYRTQVCRGCRISTHLESEMTPATKVLGGSKRGWFCPKCVERKKK